MKDPLEDKWLTFHEVPVGRTYRTFIDRGVRALYLANGWKLQEDVHYWDLLKIGADSVVDLGGSTSICRIVPDPTPKDILSQLSWTIRCRKIIPFPSNEIEVKTDIKIDTKLEA